MRSEIIMWSGGAVPSDNFSLRCYYGNNNHRDGRIAELPTY